MDSANRTTKQEVTPARQDFGGFSAFSAFSPAGDPCSGEDDCELCSPGDRREPERDQATDDRSTGILEASLVEESPADLREIVMEGGRDAQDHADQPRLQREPSTFSAHR